MKLRKPAGVGGLLVLLTLAAVRGEEPKGFVFRWPVPSRGIVTERVEKKGRKAVIHAYTFEWSAPGDKER